MPVSSLRWPMGILAGMIVTVAMTGASVAGPLDDALQVYINGDYFTAMKLVRPMAEQGVAVAQGVLGNIYADGEGVPQDYAEAMKWYRLAAEQGNTAAQNNLGGMYENGEGVPKDYVMAYFWYNLAAAGETPSFRGSLSFRSSYVESRDKVAKLLSPERLAEAQRLAREWKPKTSP